MWQNGWGSKYSVDDDVMRPESASVEEEEESEASDEANTKASICCLQGCLAATALGFSFFVGLPTGIILIVYASRADDIALISVGVVLLALPLAILILVVALCLNQRRLARVGKNRVRASFKTKQTARNQPQTAATIDTESVSTAVTTTTTASSGGSSPPHERY